MSRQCDYLGNALYLGTWVKDSGMSLGFHGQLQVWAPQLERCSSSIDVRKRRLRIKLEMRTWVAAAVAAASAIAISSDLSLSG